MLMINLEPAYKAIWSSYIILRFSRGLSFVFLLMSIQSLLFLMVKLFFVFFALFLLSLVNIIQRREHVNISTFSAIKPLLAKINQQGPNNSSKMDAVTGASS
ncbi:hypothetical protein N480_19385 [Pseudoalteromonas luteoviolacea S2607]|nr:hypothetical protein N480_19385 [Pseudoalteromonas luteoviolacea S2607]